MRGGQAVHSGWGDLYCLFFFLSRASGRFGADALPGSPGEAPRDLKRKLIGKSLILALVAREIYPPDPTSSSFPTSFFPHF